MKKTYLKTGGSVITILLVIMALMQFAPFGSYLPFPGDLASQYLPFASLYQDFFNNPSEFFYSLHNGLGGATLPLFSYYLTSPFNLLLLCFKHSHLLEGLLIIILLKVVFSSLAMTYYLQTQRKLSSTPTVLLSICYSFCGFASLYFYNILWMDVLVALPLVVAGLEQWITTKKAGLYQWSLLYLLLSSYYMGWMVSLFLGLYYFYFTAKTYNLSWWKVLRTRTKEFLAFVGRSVAIVLCLGMIYLPTIEGMLTTGKANFKLEQLFEPFFQVGVGAFAGFGIGSSNYTDRLLHYPTFYCGIAVLIIATAALLTKKQGMKQNRIMMSILLLCTIMTPLTMIFQLFQPTAGFPFRFTYLVSFMMILIASEIIESLSHYKRQLLIAGIFWGFIFIGLILWLPKVHPVMPVHPMTLWINVCLVIIWSLILTSSLGKIMRLLTIALLLAELIFQTTWSLSGIPLVKQKNLAHYNNKMEEVLKQIPQRSTLQRIDNTDIDEFAFGMKVTGYNNGLWFNYPGTSSYTSTLTNENIEYAHRLGLYSRNERRFSNFGSTPLVNALIGVSEKLVHHHDGFKSVDKPYHNTVHVMNESLHLNDRQAFKNQNTIAKALGINPVFKDETFEIQNQTKHKITLSWTQKHEGTAYLQLPNHQLSIDNAYRMTLNNRPVKFPMPIQNRCIVPLKDTKVGEKMTVTLQTPAKMKWHGLKVATFDDNAFNKQYPQVDKAPITQKGLKFYTKVKALNNHQMALIALPYNKNFKVQNNHQPVEVKRSSLGLLEVPLTKGMNHLKITYQPTAFILGCCISFIGLLIEILLLFKKQINK